MTEKRETPDEPDEEEYYEPDAFHLSGLAAAEIVAGAGLPETPNNLRLARRGYLRGFRDGADAI